MKFKSGDPIAIDFDGTCVTHEYPKIGRHISSQRVLRRIVDAGGQLILWTMRSDEQLEDAVNWFKENGIPLYGIQTNPGQTSWTTSPKAYAKIYIDDAALGCPLKKGLKGERPYVDWDAVEILLFGEEGIEDSLQDKLAEISVQFREKIMTLVGEKVDARSQQILNEACTEYINGCRALGILTDAPELQTYATFEIVDGQVQMLITQQFLDYMNAIENIAEQ